MAFAEWCKGTFVDRRRSLSYGMTNKRHPYQVPKLNTVLSGHGSSKPKQSLRPVSYRLAFNLRCLLDDCCLWYLRPFLRVSDGLESLIAPTFLRHYRCDSTLTRPFRRNRTRRSRAQIDTRCVWNTFSPGTRPSRTSTNRDR